MHTNGGDRWIVRNKLSGFIVDAFRSQMKAREFLDKLGKEDAGDYEMVLWLEQGIVCTCPTGKNFAELMRSQSKQHFKDCPLYRPF